MNVAAVVYLSVVLIMLILLGVILRISCKEDKKQPRQRRTNTDNAVPPIGNSASGDVQFTDCSQQEQNIYNISGRVPTPNPTQYPDAYLSADHISITNELNKPPKYDDAPPSYEEAIKLALAQSNSMQTLQAEQSQPHQSASSTSSSTPVVVPAVPNRTTE